MESFARSMQIFVTIAESGSMASAARALDLSSSAISQHIQKLEQQLDINLLHRNTRRLALTEAGSLYYQHCKAVLNTWQDTAQQLNQLRENPQGELRIAAPVGFAACGLLSQPLKALLQDNPQLNIRLFMQDEDIDWIVNRIDLALYVHTGPLPDSTMVARQLAEWDMVLAASPQYLSGHGFSATMPTSPDQLLQMDWLLHQNSKADHVLLQGPTGKATIPTPVKLQINNMQALIQFTRDGLGIAILPKPEIGHELKNGTLLQLLPEWQLPKLGVYAVTGTRHSQPAKVKTAIEVLSKTLQNYCSSTSYAS